MKNRLIYTTLIALLLLITLSCSNKIHTQEFKNPDNLPGKILFSKKLYETRGELFFIMRDYQENYCRLVKYNSKKGVISTIIFDIKPENGKIHEFAIDNDYIVFSTLERSEKAIQKIYLYNIKKETLSNPIITINKEYDNIYPLRLCIDRGTIAWVNQDFQTESSIIKLYNIKEKTIKPIITTPFRKNGFKVPIFFIELKRGKLFYDKKTENNYSIKIYDIKRERELASFPVMDDIELHYNATFNPKENYLAIYAKGRESDLTYLLDLTDGRVQKLAGFYPNSVIYDDRIQSDGNEIIYPVQKNVSGNINEHYYIESYNIKTFKMDRIMYCFDLVASDGYRAYLKFDKDASCKTIYFELIAQNKN